MTVCLYLCPYPDIIDWRLHTSHPAPRPVPSRDGGGLGSSGDIGGYKYHNSQYNDEVWSHQIVSTIFVVADVLLQHFYFLDMGKCMLSIRSEVSVFRDVVMLDKNKITVVLRETGMGRREVRVVGNWINSQTFLKIRRCTRNKVHESICWLDSMYYLVAQDWRAKSKRYFEPKLFSYSYWH